MKKLYIIHGWTYDVSPWEEVAKYLKEIGVSVELLRVPGLGEPSKKVWDIQKYVAWADENIADGAVVLGHSNGGRILLNLLVAKPEKLSGVILLDAAGVYEKSAKRSVLRVVAKIFAPMKKISLLRRVFHKFIGASDYDKAPENMKKTLHNMISSDKNLDASGIKTPVRIIWGENDTITPLRQGEKLHRELENSTLVVKKGWGHSQYLKDPQALAAEIAKQYIKLLEKE
ncbi:MAG: alpha/beta hydrolase [Candidatus Nomurabacteria bacterium]|jgi:pimeloyl-ACP methyl ester carboxylesterase|nr:alpha/beta hydrolase [Candidatus Nomurabacteria bacterium]